MPRDPARLVAALADYAGAPVSLNFANQAHARRIMLELGDTTNLPNFTATIDERLHYGANLLINGGLNLLDYPEYRTRAKGFLFSGAEALEHLTASRETYAGSVADEKLRCAAAYYLSDHQARAFVMLDRMAGDGLGRIETLVAALLKHDSSAAYQAVLAVFSDPACSDDGLAAAVSDDEASLDDAVGNVAAKSLANALALYLEHVRTGNATHLANSRGVVAQLISLGLESRFVDVWWWGKVVAKLLDEFEATSLWSNLPSLLPPDGDGGMLSRYIQAAARRGIFTLWPSQLKALEKIAEPRRGSFCVRMPTSSGKTRIAELAILTSFLDNPGGNAKCVYVAPFRSLAVEVERSLRAAFGPLGFAVSELYGGYEINPADAGLAEDSSILVLTPEKLDAMLRFAPEIFDQVCCVIVDEGHTTGEVGERGLRAEFILNRVLRRLPRDRCRYVFASAVLPNAQDFATWIGGGDDALVDSEWRPSRQMIGDLEWKSGRATIRYTHSGHKPFETECFIPGFITQYSWKERGRTKTHPKHPREVVALSAVRLAAQGPVLLFVPQRQHVESTAKDTLHALETQEKVEGRATAHMPLVADGEAMAAISAMASELGEDSTIVRCSHRGIAIHHGRLPATVRRSMERYIACGAARIIVATTTLAAGVNLPIRTVIVKGLWKGEGERVDPLTFWNICGRAGRGMREIEGQVLFFLDLEQDQEKLARARAYNRSMVESPNSGTVMSVLYRILNYIRSVWLSTRKDLDFASLCIRLANNDFTWAGESSEDVGAWIRLLDNQLFALNSEYLEEGNLADVLQEVLKDSLLCVQLDSAPIKGVTVELARDLLAARMKYVRGRVPERERRDAFYKTALPIDDCLVLEGSAHVFRDLAVRFKDWEGMHDADRDAWISEFVAWASGLPFTEMGEESLEAYGSLARGWLRGRPIRELATLEPIRAQWPKLDEVAEQVDSVCAFKLPWAANAAIVYLSAVSTAADGLAEICKAVPAMFSYGTLSPTACQFAPALQNDIRLAERAGNVCPFDFGDPRGFAWFRNVSQEELVNLGLDPEVADKIIGKRRNASIRLSRGRATVRLDARSLIADMPAETLVFAVPQAMSSGVEVELIGPDGTSFGLFHDSSNSISEWQGVQWTARHDPGRGQVLLYK